MRSRNFKTVLAGSVCALALNGAAFAQTRTFDVPAGDLSAALDLYIRQSGEQLIYRVADVRGMRTSGVQGALNSEEALQQLLSGTDLRIKRDPSGLIAIASATAPQSGSAAGAGAEVEALIVTAQKREEDIQDVPIAMSAFSQETLERTQIAGGPDLMTQVPNMTFTKTNFSSYSIQIRGIGTQAISAAVDPAVAVAFNSTPFVRNRFFEQEFYDLARVEVLRGPQGTLYGRNATAGVVNIISAVPRFDFEAKASADIANYNSSRLEGMVNLPLVEDMVALRLAGAWTKREGYSVNTLTGNPIDGRDLWSTRVSLRFDPTDRLTANLIWEHFEEDDDRIRSGKQVCKTAVAPEEVGGFPTSVGGGGVSVYDANRFLDQGCVAASMYAAESYRAPSGNSLPYYLPLAWLGVPVIGVFDDNFDVYQNRVQSRNLREIESGVDPWYRAHSDLVELNIDYDLTDQLSFASQTGFSQDFIWSTQDYNRYATRPGAFYYVDCSDATGWCINGNEQVFPDGNGTGVFTDRAPGFVGGLACDPDSDSFCAPTAIFCDPQIGCSDRLMAVDLSEARSRQFSQEFRLASDYNGAINFSVGANYLRYKTLENYYVFINTLTMTAAGPGFGAADHDAPWIPGVTDGRECLARGFQYVDPFGQHDPQHDTCAYIDPNPITSLNGQGHNYFVSKNPYKLQSYAAFGEVYYNITSSLKLTTGLRWTVDRKQFTQIPSQLLIAGYGYPVTGEIEQEWREPTGRILLDWKPDLAFTDETLVYGSYVRGYKAGGANPPGAALLNRGGQESAFPVHPATFDAEFVDAYELGTKNTLLDGALTLNVNAFYYDYTGYQISQIVDRSAVNLNFDANIWGVELETDWRPVENLKFALKVGYEDTRLADGSRAVDLMDRTGGDPYWMVVRPFPTQASNCILPTYVVAELLEAQGDSRGTEVSSACGRAYINGPTGEGPTDPVTGLPYVADPVTTFDGRYTPTDYPGFNPATAPNNGAGVDVDLSGHQLPNAPHWTTTLSTDYTLPLPSDWLMTLHTDFYYQSEAWTRVFNLEGYDKLKAYYNVNVAAIFTNEDAGWKVMAYVKNVLDADNITGAFLNSDDSQLTTNVFVNEPRLYGLRVTKEWNGAPWWNSAGVVPGPFRVELDGAYGVFGNDSERFVPQFADLFSDDMQFPFDNQDSLDWGTSGGVKLTYSPIPTWSLSGAVRYGRAGGNDADHREEAVGYYCNVSAQLAALLGVAQNCELSASRPQGAHIPPRFNYYDIQTKNEESDTFVDFLVGKEFGLGAKMRSAISAGLAYGRWKSMSEAILRGQPDVTSPAYALTFGSTGLTFHPTTAHSFNDEFRAYREFEGAGPAVTWDVAVKLAGDAATWGELGVELGVGGGVLFGRQDVEIDGRLLGTYRQGTGYHRIETDIVPPVDEQVSIVRTDDVEAPFLRANLGLTYTLGAVKLSGGYRAERYYNVIDGGYQQRETYDRDFGGAYFKIAVGFGG